MQFRNQKEFILRRATASDRGELLALQQKYGAVSASILPFADASGFAAELTRADTLFQVALNSNGVMIGFLYCTAHAWQELVVNPNFMKKELKEALLLEVKNWAATHTVENEFPSLLLKPKLISGDWKAFVKQCGYQIEKSSLGSEKLIFAKN